MRLNQEDIKLNGVFLHLFTFTVTKMSYFTLSAEEVMISSSIVCLTAALSSECQNPPSLGG